MTDSEVHSNGTGKEQVERIRADELRRKNLIPFDWRELPRVDWPFGNAHAKSFDGWAIEQTDGRKICGPEVSPGVHLCGQLDGGAELPNAISCRSHRARRATVAVHQHTPGLASASFVLGKKGAGHRWQGHQLRMDDVAPRSVYR